MHTKVARFLKENQFIAGILFLILLWFLFSVKDILIALFIAFIIMAALVPIADFLRRMRFPHGAAVGVSYIVVLGFFILLVATIVPFFVSQVQALIVNFPFYLDKAANLIGLTVDAGSLQTLITSELNIIGQNAVAVTKTVFGGFFSVVTVFVVSFYLLLDHKRIRTTIASFFPENQHAGTLDLLDRIEEKLGAWLRGQFVLSFFVGFITWVTLELVGLPFALPLAILAGVLEIVPTLGPLLASIPAIIVALTVSPTLALIVGIVYFVIQLLENNLLVPRIMERAVGLNPIVVIVGILIGGNLLGLAGALLSIPFISCVAVVINHYKDK